MVALADFYSDAARADWLRWRADVLAFSDVSARGSRLRSAEAVAQGLVPGTPLLLSDDWNALLSSGYYSGGSRLRSRDRVASGMSAVQPFPYGYVNGANIVAFPYGKVTPAGLAIGTFSFQVYDTGATNEFGEILPLAGATVKITLQFAIGGVPAGTVYTAVTNINGLASFTVVEGWYGFEISKPGYVTKVFDPTNFGDGGGYIAALDPVTDGGGTGNPTLLIAFAVIAVGGLAYFSKRR